MSVAPSTVRAPNVERQLPDSDVVASGSVDVPVTTSGGGGCEDGQVTFTINLAPQPGSI